MDIVDKVQQKITKQVMGLEHGM